MPNEFDTPQSRVEAILQNMLGAENELPPPKSRIEYYLQKILEEGGDSTTFKVFNPDWVTDSTTAAFCASVNSDPEAVAGMAYLGELTCSDLPFNGNADAVVEIIDGTGTSGKVIHIVITSGNIAPYRWEYTYWNDGANVSGWIAYATTNTVQANPTLAGTEANLTGLEVNGVKYKAGGSEQHLYRHIISIMYRNTSGNAVTFDIYNDDATPFNNTSLLAYLGQVTTYQDTAPYIIATGDYYHSSHKRVIVQGIQIGQSAGTVKVKILWLSDSNEFISERESWSSNTFINSEKVYQIY